jgi:type I restriction enzyme R subunit
MLWGVEGKPVSVEEFLNSMFGQMPNFYTSIEDLREKWCSPKTREELLDKMSEAGYDKDVLNSIRTLIDADGSDLLDVFEYISFNVEPIQRKERVQRTETYVSSLSAEQQEFVNYIISQYIREGIEELGTSKLPELLNIKYGSVQDGITALGGLEIAKNTFYDFQRNLYLN